MLNRSLLHSNTYGFSPQTKFFIVPQKSLFLMTGLLGFYIIHLPSYYFYRLEANVFSFLFLSKFPFVSFLRHLSYYNLRLSRLFFAKLRLRGLGFKVKRLAPSLFRFYFNMEMFTHFHVPSNVLLRSRKNRMLILSHDLSLLKSLIGHILLLRKAGGYNKRGLWFAKALLFLRKRRKI